MICVQSIFYAKYCTFFLKLLEQLRRAELASHLPFFKCSIAARKMWRCQLQTKVSCGSLWTRGATWYLWLPFARAPGLQGRWNFFHGKGHDVRTFGLKNLGNRPAGSALKSTLYSAGEFNKVGSFRRCSRKKAELLLLWRRARAATMRWCAAQWVDSGRNHTWPYWATGPSQLQAKKVIDKKIIGQTATGN